MRKKLVKCGGIVFGDGNIHVQSMLKAPPEDIQANVRQASRLAEAGCAAVRVAVPEKKDAALIFALKKSVKVPIIADIHNDYKTALEAVGAGADKIRINPGNIGGADRVKKIASACKAAGIPIRAGVNSGSLKSGGDAVQSALESIRLLERFDFDDIVVSVKSSSVQKTVADYRKLAELCPYPLHVGVTESGTARIGLIKSAIGIGSLLCDNIGDTIRVSLTAEPEREVEAAYDILKAAGIRRSGAFRAPSVEVVSCPACGRTRIDVAFLARQTEELTRGLGKDIKIAVMGCAVNGPGECGGADFGITGGDGEGLIYKNGKIVGKVTESELLPALMEEIKGWQN
ncbi:MAG: flavodoxin-dependent (E)-4-hydroxy-3-methylbut-2-enyl-diphosphate synthase [Oscillospiraceae bacterium]|jgi:(E)-4-hydroxy-3-methylbut-2-enyl-diphosphate synthase|nr:flavodoxin-dependent (E)-4-hydroxy-3-methylbut-2-enyl-diphosphate synthase [Oscillospiraceae bacterium]